MDWVWGERKACLRRATCSRLSGVTVPLARRGEWRDLRGEVVIQAERP